MAHRGLLLLLPITALVIGASGVQYVHDELLWTKQLWDKYQLDFPYSAFKTKEVDVTRALAGAAKGLVDSTLNGPQGDLQSLIEEDIKKSSELPSSFDVSLLGDDISIEAAAGVCQCKVCLALARALVSGLATWVERHQRLPSAAQVARYAEAVCETEVPVEVLRDWVILRAKVRGGAGEAPAWAVPNASPPAAPLQEFYMLSRRQRQHSTDTEIALVQATCQGLTVQTATSPAPPAAPPPPAPEPSSADKPAGVGGGVAAGSADASAPPAPPSAADAATADFREREDGSEAPLVVAVLSVLRDYRGRMKRRQADLGGPPAPGTEPAAADDVADPEPDRSCYNRHPQCEFWAQLGECEGNPNYMVGPSAEKPGWCRLACKACEPPPKLRVPEGRTEEEAAEIVSGLVAAASKAACEEGRPCRWSAEGGLGKELLSSAGAESGADPTRAALLQGAVIVGPVGAAAAAVAAAAAAAVQTVDEELLRGSVVQLVLAAKDALVASSRRKTRAAGATPPEAPDAPAARALWEHLAHRCLYFSEGYWSYELCYMASTTQIHVKPGTRVIDWEIALGGYAEGTWRPRNATDAALFPNDVVVPHVQHALRGGAPCNLTEEPVPGGRQPRLIPRSAVLRFMCSPDAAMHAVAREPSQCRYVVDVYLPQLCGVEGMAPVAGGGRGGEADGRDDAEAQGEEERKDEL